MSSTEDPTAGAVGAAARATTPGPAPGAPGTAPGAPALVPSPDVDRDLPLDAHLHTNLSPDSDVPIDVYCALAVERGIREIAITDHVDFDAARVGTKPGAIARRPAR